MHYVLGAVALLVVAVVAFQRRKKYAIRTALKNAESDDQAFAKVLYLTNLFFSQEICGYHIICQHDVRQKEKWVLVKKEGVLLFRVRVPLSLESVSFQVYLSGSEELRSEMRKTLLRYYRRKYGVPIAA
ncbi:MAG: hypothetical protein AAB489_00810 [Patescibacteria group bacterium]